MSTAAVGISIEVPMFIAMTYIVTRLEFDGGPSS